MLQFTNTYHNSSTSTLMSTTHVAVSPSFPVKPKSRFPKSPSTSLLLRPQEAGPSSQRSAVVPQVAAPAIAISPLRIPSKRIMPPSTPPRAREPRRHSNASKFSQGKGPNMSNTLSSQAGGDLESSSTQDSSKPNVSTPASNVGRVTSVLSPAHGYGDICSKSTPGHLASSSIMLRGGRDPGSSASSSTRRKPKGARPPSIRVADKVVDRVTSHSTSTGFFILTPPPTADIIKRTPLTPSELRAKLQQRAGAPSDSEVLASSTGGSLKRSTRVRRDGSHHPVSRSESALRIITDFSQPLSDVSLQGTPTLSVTRFVGSSGMYSPASTAPSSPREAQTPHDSPVHWEDSPCTASSKYSISCVQPLQESPCAIRSASSNRGDPIHIEWDDTGYLSPEQPSTGSNDASGVHLKRQNTDTIKELLRLRRGRAGME